MPSGSEIVDDYYPYMLDRCIECDGTVLVAEVDGEVAGFVTILTRVESEESVEGEIEYGLVSDLVVASKFSLNFKKLYVEREKDLAGVG